VIGPSDRVVVGFGEFCSIAVLDANERALLARSHLVEDQEVDVR
jgi:hypothetical protein